MVWGNILIIIMAEEEGVVLVYTYLSLANLRQEEDLKLSTRRSFRYIQEVKFVKIFSYSSSKHI